ncbi:hypothetical protein [Spiroplasma culicicola]|uniref:Uncharacterized protein n=1 Tax=Spiroplasma culicicola AES-1 TaxID=1276246 RepID=W6AGC6_9MOLU|nr:hypothetical protein [Spiroplasma culicicola]AHI52714.1 hypothetical protein SCULI_v1c03730 [Spiroplasma culicicola AES-1]
MSDKIKVLQINREINKEVKSVNGKKVFKPVDDVWYEDNSSSVSMDFDRTLNFKKNVGPKISLVQNANSHFFKPETNQDMTFKKEDIGANDFESLNIVDRRFTKRSSALPDQILKLRDESYQNQQAQKDVLLEKLNVNLKFKNNFENYNLTNLNDIPVSKNKQFIEDVKKSLLNTDTINQQELITPSREKTKKIDEPIITNEVFEQKQPEEVTNENVSPFDPNKLNDLDIAKSPNFVLEEQKKDEIKNEVAPINKNEISIKEQNHLFNIESESFIEDLSIPVIRDFDKTYTEQTDDLERVIKELENNKTKLNAKNIDLFVTEPQNDTTMLVNRLANGANEIRKLNLSAAKFDDFESWFNSSKDVAKLAKLAKKEKKRMTKNSKGK